METAQFVDRWARPGSPVGPQNRVLHGPDAAPRDSPRSAGNQDRGWSPFASPATPADSQIATFTTFSTSSAPQPWVKPLAAAPSPRDDERSASNG